MQNKIKIGSIFPYFIIGFLAFGFIRTIGDPYVDPFSSGADAVDIGTNIPDRTRFDQVAEPLLELPDFLTGSSGKDKPKILQIRDTTGGNQEDGNQNQQPQKKDINFDGRNETEEEDENRKKKLKAKA